MSTLGPTIVCAGEDRRNAVAAQMVPPKINGIDFVEVDESGLPATPPTLHLHFLFDVSTAGLTAGNFTIDGGERITDVAVATVTPHAGDVTVVDLLLNEQGDFSPYVLVFGPSQSETPATFWTSFDPQLSATPFHFHLTCPARFDCKPVDTCPPAPQPPVTIDYLARDYATFRQVMLDRMSLLAPAWTETDPADAGIALVELIAFAADRLSYRQDAAATEAYLETARLRTSVRRHARLVDYAMNEGCNARAWLHLQLAPPGSTSTLVVPAGTRFVTQLAGQPTLLPDTDDTYQTIALTGAEIFESLGPLTVDGTLDQMPFYAWSATECCLPVGATQGTLLGSYPHLMVGTVAVLTEIMGPHTGNAEDADPQKRWPVLITSVTPTTDPLDGTPVTNITWDAGDALPFPLCVSHSVLAGDATLTYTSVSAAIGNIVLVDNGRTLGAPVEIMPEIIGTVVAGFPFRPSLAQKNLTFAGPNPYTSPPDGTFAVSATAATTVDPTTATPVSLQMQSQEFDPITNLPVGTPQTWYPVATLFDPAVAETPTAFVVEMENDRTAYLRFGDGINGETPDPNLQFSAQYRIGNGASGNVGAETIAHVLGTGLSIGVVTNPLTAAGGIDPESLDDVRLNAPYAFNVQERAVTLADYAAVTERYPAVLRAVAVFRVTRSWRTVFITVELSDGLTLQSPGQTPGNTVYDDLQALLDLYRMAGNDVEFANVKLVAIDVVMHVCVDPDYRRDEVQQALLTLFSDGILPDGTEGFFYPDRFLMGAPYYLGPLIAAAQNVTGVQSVQITTFQRSDTPGDAGLTAGYLTAAIDEAFTLRNDPNYPERGTFTLTVDGGR